MLDIIVRKSYSITETEKKDNALFLKSEKGILRVKPQNDFVARISYTEDESFSDYIGIGIDTDNDFSEWFFEENEKQIVVLMPKLTICIDRATASLKYYDEKGSLLLSERDSQSREVGVFKAYKTVVDENTKIEEVDTPDGKKQVIKEATTIFDKNLYHSRLNLQFQDDEKIYGLGQAEEGILNLRGTTQYMHQANLKIAIPMMLSTKGYGILLSSGSTAIFNDTAYGTYLYTEAEEFMDFYFIAGEKFDDVIKGYRFLTGKAVMLPRWAFGFMQSQERYETQEEIVNVVKEHRERNIGLDCIVLDWRSWEGEHWGQKTFDTERFPSPSQMMKDLHDEKVRFMISVWPNMRKQTANYAEFFENKLLMPASESYDPYNKDARDLYWKQANEGLFTHGIDSWWCDSSEGFCPEWMKIVKPEPSAMYHDFVETASKYVQADTTNAYGLLHSKTMYDGQRRTTEEKRVMNLTRSTYTGGQKYGVVLWSGDTYASWENMQKQIVAGLNFCVTGLPYWTLDIGAFFVKKGMKWFWNGDYPQGLDDLGYRELFVRWFQYAVFLPVFRSHGTDVRREMWKFDDENNHMFYDALVKANQLRYTLIPYIYSMAGRVWLKDYTMMRMLAFDFAHDEKALSIKDEFMFGDSILVCTVTKPMYYGVDSTELEGIDKTQKVYLPKGADWFDYYTGEKYSGGQEIVVDADINKIPLFVKAGSIIPMTKPLHCTDELDNAEIEIHVYKGADCTFDMYEDKADGYDYEKGDYKITTFTWNDKEEKLHISSDEDKYKIIVH